MSVKNKSIKEIKDIENAHLSIYPTLPAHTWAADEKTIKRNFYFIDFLNGLGLIKDGAKVLDIGCGTGWFVEMFRQKGYAARGGDILPTEVMYQRWPQGKFLFFDFFEPPQDPQKYDLIFMRSLCIDKLSDLRDFALFPWIGEHLNDGGILYFAHNSNGSAIYDGHRCHLTEPYIVGILEKTIGSVLYCNRLPENMIFVVQKGSTQKLNNQATRTSSYILSNLWKGPQKSALYWLIHGMPVLIMPENDLNIISSAYGKQLKFLDCILILRTYPIRTIKHMIKRLHPR